MFRDSAIRAAPRAIEAGMRRFGTGDSGPFKQRWSHEADVSNMVAWDAAEVGWSDTEPRLDWAAAWFKGGGWTQEPLSAAHRGELLETVTIERMEPVLEGHGAPGRSEPRVTHVFRREDGVWKVDHRHADPIVSKTEAATIPRR